MSENIEKTVEIIKLAMEQHFNIFGKKTSNLLPSQQKSQTMDSDDTNDNICVVVKDTISQLEIIQKNITECEEKARTALRRAQEACNISVGFFHRDAPVLEALQSAAKNLAESQVSMADSQGLLFNQQEVMAKAIKKLYLLSLCNIESTRDAVRSIKTELENASAQKISATAQQELENVVNHLMHQLDLLERQEKMEMRIAELENNEQEMSERIEKQQGELENKVLAIGRDTQAFAAKVSTLYKIGVGILALAGVLVYVFTR